MFISCTYELKALPMSDLFLHAVSPLQHTMPDRMPATVTRRDGHSAHRQLGKGSERACRIAGQPSVKGTILLGRRLPHDFDTFWMLNEPSSR